MWHMKERHLIPMALVLAVAAAWGISTTGPGSPAPALIGRFALVFLLELPALFVRIRGGGVVSTFAAALLPPLVVLEAYWGVQASRARPDLGGDLQGFELGMVKYVVPVVVLVTGSIVASLTCLLIKRGRAD